MKNKLAILAILSIYFLFPAAVCSAAETGFGWTVGTAYDGRGSILYTNNSGQNWTYQGTGQIANVDMAGVYAVNGRTAYVVGAAESGYGTIYRTTDAGTTWTRLGSTADIPDVAIAKVHGYGNQKIWAVGTGTILHSSDGGANWVNTCPAGYGTTLLQGVTTTDGHHVWVTGGNKDGYATILYSDNAGVSWTRQGGTSGVTAADHIIGVAAADNKKLWAVGGGLSAGNLVLATTDGGTRWVKVHDAGLGDGNEVSVVNASTIWTAMDSHVLRTVNGGADWESHNTQLFTMGISAFSADQAWAVANGIRGAIYYTADGGATPWNVTLLGPDGAVLPQLFTISMSTSTKEVYPQAVENAKAHADAPATWVAADASMVKVSAAGSVGANPYGLKYYGAPANNQLIVRTLSSGNAYNGAWGTTTTAGTNYAIYGNKTSMNTWVTTGKGMTEFIASQGLAAGTIVKGLERGLGMSATGTHDAIFEMAVTVGDTANPYLLRPTRNPDPTVYNSTNPADHGTYGAFPANAQAAGIGTGTAADAVYASYKAAYLNWAAQAYSTSPFPWTQLGYTYYWGQVENVPANLSDVQGMSEFILLGGTGSSDPTKTPSGTNESGRVVAIGIYAPQSYIYTKNNGTSLSDDATAQYGNGFASFNVTGACDTLWAGAAFQVGANPDAATPNTITIGAGGTVSGGQGILVGSRNYTVTNAGVITANANTRKFNIADTENIALLFKGDMQTAPYIGDVKNILINSGAITAPGDNGTAVMVWAGNTDITNTGTITGSGTGYAIKTSSGNDVVRIDGGAVTGHIDLGTGIDSLVVRTGGIVTGRVTTGDYATVAVDGGTLNMTGGVISAGGITGGNNADVVNLSGGVVNGDIRTGAGNDTVTLSGGQVNGSINLGSNIADAFSANNATLGFALSRDTQATAKIQGMQTANIANTGSVTLIPRIAEPASIRDQESFLLVAPNAGGSLQTDTSRITVQDDASYPMIRFSLSQNGNNLSLIASRDNRYYARNSGNSSLGAVLDALAGSGNAGADMQRVLGALDASGAAANAARLQPVVDNGILQASRAAFGGFLGAVVDRLDNLRSGQPLANQTSTFATLGAALDALAGSGNAGADTQRFIGALDASDGAANASRFQSVVDNGIAPARRTAWGGLSGADTGRMDHFRYGQSLADAGNAIISTGGASGDRGLWARGLGSYLHQGARDASNGYDANVWGVATGYDVLLREDLRFGGGFGYAKNRIKSKDNGGDADSDSFQGTLYASLTKKAGYLNGSLSLAYNCYRGSRQIVFPGVNRTANSEYDGQQYSLYLEGGHVLKTGGFTWTPLASIQYEHLRLDGYTEKNAGDLNLKVNGQNYNMAMTGLGLKLGYAFQGSYGTFLPELHAKWLYDLMNDHQQSTATFTGGGASFTTSGFTPARSSYHLGTKISLVTRYNIELSVDYDFEYKNDFYGHSGYVNARYAF